ncbi:MAG: FG-GAP-like repeat-containing protein, partial [Flavobacteriales bacterium]
MSTNSLSPSVILCAFLVGTTVLKAQPYTAEHTQVNLDARAIDTNKPVGGTLGVHGVSAMGTATYSIPIQMAPGTNGMVPEVAIVYDSRSANGFLGYGWNISGLSAIARAGRDPYHDGTTSPIGFASEDRFVLDGQRLVCTSGSYGSVGSTYDTENASFAAVTLLSVGGGNEEFYFFRVVTKDGMTLEYGLDWNSKILSASGEAVLIWRLNRKMDAFGNYIDYRYSGNSGDSWLTEIRYTGNLYAFMAPYNNVYFTYQDRTDDNMHFVPGAATSVTKLLKTIEVKGEGGALVRRYDLTYSWRYDRGSYLNDITETGADGSTSFNATQFAYGNLWSHYFETDVELNQGGTIDVFVGDFDGSGVGDLLVAEVQYSYGARYHDNFRVYLNGSTLANYYYDLPGVTEIQAMDSYWRGMHFNDLNGDGRDDILIANVQFDQNIYPSNPSDDWSNDGLGAWEFLSFTVMTSTSTIYNTSFAAPVTYNAPAPLSYFKRPGNYMQQGDYNGDGKQDAICVFNHPYQAVSAEAYLFSDGSWSQLDISTNFLTSALNNADRMLTGDFNGDGKAELMVFRDFGNDTYYAIGIDNANVAYSVRSGDFFWKYEADRFDLFPGDFNGDRITDYLVRDHDAGDTGNEPDWYILTGKPPIDIYAQGFEATRFYPVHEYNDDIDEMIVADLDGNGLSDIFHHYLQEGERRSQVYYGYGHDGTQPLFHAPAYYVSSSNTNEVTVGDYNGDGRQDILGSNDYNQTVTVIQFGVMGRERNLHSVSNAFCDQVKFLYQNLSNPYVHNHGPVYEYPLNYTQVPILVVSMVTEPNGIGSTMDTHYQYERARLHRTGRGFLGFTKLISYNGWLNKRTELTREINTTYFVGNLVDEKVFCYDDMQLVSHSEYTYNFATVGPPADKRFCLQLMTSTITNGLSGGVSTINNAWDSYGNIVISTENVGGGNMTTTTWNNYSLIGPGQVPNKLIWTNVTATRSGQPNASRSTSREFDNTTGGLKKVVDFLALPGAVTTQYVRNAFGLVTKETVGHATLPAIDYRILDIEYDTKGRYVTRRTRQWNDNGTLVPVVERFANDVRWGAPTNKMSSDGLTELFVYDVFGREKEYWVPHIAGSLRFAVQKSYSWDFVPGTHQYYKRTIVHPGKPTVEEGFDAKGRVVMKRSEVNWSGDWTESVMQYDFRGHVVRETGSHLAGEPFNTLERVYDIYDRLESVNNDVYSDVAYQYSYNGNGEATEVMTASTGQTRTTITDATGVVLSVEDDGAELTYSHDSWGNVRRVRFNGSTAAMMEYDDYGRQEKLWDPNVGYTKYVYDPFGQLVQQTDAANNVTKFTYDNMGRRIKRDEPEGATTWTYYKNGTKVNSNPVRITGLGSSYVFEYADPYLRLSKKRKLIDGVYYDTKYTYDGFDNVATLTYPSGLSVGYSYTNVGNVDEVTYGGETLFGDGVLNGQGQYTEYAMGSLPPVSKTYDHGFPTRTTSVGIQDLETSWDLQSGNLKWRWDHLKGRKEDLDYDVLNRLTRSEVNEVDGGGNILNPIYNTPFEYDGTPGATKGNLTVKSDVGQLKYASHKVTGAYNIDYPTPPDQPPAVINYLETQSVSYKTYHQTDRISETVGGVAYGLRYSSGPDHQRYKSVLDIAGQVEETRLYVDGYEKQTSVGASAVREIHYVQGGDGLCAMLVRVNGVTSVHYVFKDHLGSILTTVHASGMLWGISGEQSFDAWGRERNASDWTYDNITPGPAWLYRGYTGHEHVEPFALVNMNGRMYDPVNGRMLSADKLVASLFSSQAFNRYSYGNNNPMKYVDPDGNFAFIPILV